MNELVIQDISTQPEEVLRFPDFIFGALARRGIGSVEASLSVIEPEPHSPTIPWQYYSRTTHTFESVAEIPRTHFRPILARFAFFCGISPYSGHTLFATQWPVCGSLVSHRFSVYLCNEPTMDFWIRIYLYGIDGFYPNFQ